MNFHAHNEARSRDPCFCSRVYNPLSYWWLQPFPCKIDTMENSKFISKNSSNGGGWKKFSKENVGNVSYVLKEHRSFTVIWLYSVFPSAFIYNLKIHLTTNEYTRTYMYISSKFANNYMYNQSNGHWSIEIIESIIAQQEPISNYYFRLHLIDITRDILPQSIFSKGTSFFQALFINNDTSNSFIMSRITINCSGFWDCLIQMQSISLNA
jgi:hypothetical protein